MMGGKKLIALYKAYSGGEWFRASLESVAPAVDGFVVVFSDGPWMHALDMECDCSEPLDEFKAAHPDVQVTELVVSCDDQGRQYEAGIEAVRMAHGIDAGVMIADTDEVWDLDAVMGIRELITQRPDADLFRSRIQTYLKCPLYQVWPQEPAWPVVGLGNARAREVRGRFNFNDGACRVANTEITYHHFPYVRNGARALRAKMLNTGSQEHVPSDMTWIDRVYDRLPFGRDIHMSAGFEHVWQEIKVLPAPPECVRTSAFAQVTIRQASAEWRRWLQTAPPDQAVYPTPNAADLEKYAPEMRAAFKDRADRLGWQFKTTVLEGLVLAGLAASTPRHAKLLEIGCGHGGSTACMMLAAHDAHITCVDPFLPYDEETHAGTARGVTEGDEAAFNVLACDLGYAATDRLTQVKRTSHDAARDFRDKAFDLVFVDGNHSYSIVRGDLELYWPKVRPGGLLCGHDYTTRFPGVVRATDEWAERNGIEVETPPGTSIFVCRKKEG